MKRALAVPAVAALLGALAVVAPARSAHAEALCAATPESAVLQGLGLTAHAAGADGFRVRDVIVDSALHRAFVRVESCGHSERPLLLLPFAAGGVTAGSDPVAPLGYFPAAPRPGAATMAEKIPAVPSGTTVAVAMLDERINLTVRGHLLQAAAVGNDVDVQLVALDGSTDATRRVRGRLTSENRVEVQP